jgi:hypothetical protein
MKIFEKIFRSFKEKKFKYGGYATLMVAVVIAVLAAINILVDQLPWKADLTKEKIYSLSEQTYSILDSLEKDVMIYALYEVGRENPTVDEILKKYKRHSKKIDFKYMDPLRNPAFASKYAEDDRPPGANSLIVTSGDRFKVISPYDMVNYAATDPNNPYDTQAQSLKIEQEITSAFIYVTSEKDTTIFYLTGHGEWQLPFDMSEQLERENYVVDELNLQTKTEVPGDTDILLIISPKQDITEREEEMIRDYLFERRGRVVIMIDYFLEEYPNLNAILKSYGVGIKRVIVVERDASRHYPQIPIALFPELPYHSITSSLNTNDMAVFVPRSQAIERLDIKRRTIEIEPFMVTSNKSWAKTDLESDYWEQTLNDPNGPFELAVTVTDKGEKDQKDSKAIIIASSFFLFPDRAGFPIQFTGNANIVPNMINWLQDREELISIRPKSLRTIGLYKMRQVHFYVYAGITIILIPLLILGAGLFIWLRRRHL